MEAAVHAVRLAFQDESTEGILLVDTSNAFNALNRRVTLHNIQYICPALATVMINTYRDDAELFVGGFTLYSEEGTTQGDPLFMPMYAQVTVSLIHKLKKESTNIKQVWYAMTPLLWVGCSIFDCGGRDCPPLAVAMAILPTY